MASSASRGSTWVMVSSFDDEDEVLGGFSMPAETNVKKLFFFVIYEWTKKARASVPSDQFKPVACTIKIF